MSQFITSHLFSFLRVLSALYPVQKSHTGVQIRAPILIHSLCGKPNTPVCGQQTSGRNLFCGNPNYPNGFELELRRHTKFPSLGVELGKWVLDFLDPSSDMAIQKESKKFEIAGNNGSSIFEPCFRKLRLLDEPTRNTALGNSRPQIWELAEDAFSIGCFWALHLCTQ
jgi:hypothetical protein